MARFRYVVDNLGGNSAAAVIRSGLRPRGLASFATAYFTVSGFELVADKLETCSDFRLLLGSEPETDPLRMTMLDIWKNLDLRSSTRQAERAVRFFSRDSVAVRLHPGPFFHGKAYLLNHPRPLFEKQATSLRDHSPDVGPTSATDVSHVQGRDRPTGLRYVGSDMGNASSAAALVGSSNFTYGGLSKNTELNLLDPSGQSILEVLTWFEERWNAARDFKEEFLELLRGYHRPLEPFWIYAKALYELYKEDLEPESADRPGSTIELADFQRAGVKAARRVLDEWHRVLIADAPGLGKTFIAGKLLEEFAYYGREKPLIVCPAEVEGVWRKFARKYDVRLNPDDIVHTEILGRGIRNGTPAIHPARYADRSIVIVDECHHFRNPDSARYSWLQELLSFPIPQVRKAGKVRRLPRKVIFVSATPVNNSVWDLYWQLRLLFGEDSLSEVAEQQGISDVPTYFKNAEEGNGNLYDLLERVAVRRSRMFIRERYPTASIDGKPIHFPSRTLETLSYSLAPSLSGLYGRAAQVIERLHLVPYRLEGYRKGERDETRVRRGELLAVLFRVLLLKRLESSLWAFRVSTNRMAVLFRALEADLSAGRDISLDLYREYLDVLERAEEDGVDVALPRGGFEAEAISLFQSPQMLQDLRTDLKELDRILARLPGIEADCLKVDTKARVVVDELGKRKHKTIVFCSFKDTADYLYHALRTPGVPVALVTGDDSKLWDGTGERGAGREKVIEMFSPRSNEAIPGPELEVDLLIATDVFSEAINLQDADAVLNYDLPWNPMRLVQRAGRVDRIGSLHDQIVVQNLFPEQGLDELLKLMALLRDKISQAQRAVGLEESVLGEEPLPVDFAATLERIREKDSRVLVDLERKIEQMVGLDPQEQLLAILQTLSKDELDRIPEGAGSVTVLDSSATAKRPGMFVAYRHRRADKTFERIWRFFPGIPSPHLSNKTEIVDLIRFPRAYPAEDRFGDATLAELRLARSKLEVDLRMLAARRRTRRISGPLRRAFALSQKHGRADLFSFLQESGSKDAVERALRRVNFRSEGVALRGVQEIARKFGGPSPPEPPVEEPPSQDPLPTQQPEDCELPPPPPGTDSGLELVCWMEIRPSKADLPDPHSPSDAGAKKQMPHGPQGPMPGA